jgi:6-phosphogluconolactonase
MSLNRTIMVLDDAAIVAETAAERIVARLSSGKERFAVCLTGGSSPKQLYALLTETPWASRIPWPLVHWFIGDERFVAPDDPLNNMAMARRILLDRFAPTENVHPILTNAADPDEAARRYETALQSFYGGDRLDPLRPLFDVTLMGVGPDGHTASLFPGDPAITESERWVVGVPQAHVEPFVPRVTLTLPALGACREMLFEVVGADKRSILSRVLAGEDLPAARAHSLGETIWLVDRAAMPEDFRGR